MRIKFMDLLHHTRFFKQCFIQLSLGIALTLCPNFRIYTTTHLVTVRLMLFGSDSIFNIYFTLPVILHWIFVPHKKYCAAPQSDFVKKFLPLPPFPSLKKITALPNPLQPRQRYFDNCFQKNDKKWKFFEKYLTQNCNYFLQYKLL